MYWPFNIFVNLTKHIVEIASLMPQYVADVVAGPLGYSALTLEYNLKKNMLVHIVIWVEEQLEGELRMVERAKVRVLSLETRGSFIGYEEQMGVRWFVCLFCFLGGTLRFGPRSGGADGDSNAPESWTPSTAKQEEDDRKVLFFFYFFFVFSDWVFCLEEVTIKDSLFSIRCHTRRFGVHLKSFFMGALNNVHHHSVYFKLLRIQRGCSVFPFIIFFYKYYFSI